MTVAITKASQAMCRKKVFSMPRRCAKVEAAIRTGTAMLTITLGQREESILKGKIQTRLHLTQKMRTEKLIVVRGFYSDEERSTKLRKGNFGV